ncbi:MAG: hypothetical protein ABUK01_09000 [Leptospirales bacterium]
MIRALFTLLLLSFTSMYCSSTQTTDDESYTIIEDNLSDEIEPQNPLDVYRNSEATDLSKRASGGSPSITILASSKPVSRQIENKEVELSIPVGSGTPITCSITKKEVLVSQELLSHIKHLSSSENIASYSIYEYKTELAGDIVHMNYIFDYYDHDKKFGNYKLSILHKPGLGSVICLHDEPGYYETFHKVVHSLARSDYLRKKFSQSGSYKSRKIFIVYLNEKSIGYFESYAFYESSDLELHVENFVETIPLNETQFAISERKNVAYISSVSGELLSQQSTGYKNGKQVDYFTISRVDKGKYKVKGTFKEKPIQAELNTDLPVIDSESAIFRVIKNYKKGITDAFVYSEFLTAYPTRFSKSELFLISESKGKYKLKYNSSDNLKMNIEADNTGTLNITTENDNIKFSMHRVYYKTKN